MTYIAYIYVVEKNGFISDTKIRKEIDMDAFKQGDMITSCYDETFPLYNFCMQNDNKEYAAFEDGKLVFLSQERIIEKIQALFPLFINQVASSKAGDLLNDYKKADGSIDRPSVFKEYLQQLTWKTNFEMTPVVETFSLAKYRDLANELHFLSDCYSVPHSNLGHFVKSSVSAFNTFLARDGVINDFSAGLFSTDRNEETSEEAIYFSTALSSIHYASRICDSSSQFGQKKEETKKLKI